MKKALLAACISLVILLLPLQASALTVDGVLYDQTMRCLIVTGGFGKYPDTNANLVNDGGHTANLLNASGTAIPCYGYWYNSVLGVDRSKAVGAGTYVNGGNVGYVRKSTWQHANVNTGTGYQGSISSPYRGISRDIDKDLVTDTFIPNAANLVWSFNIQKNSVYANIIGLDSTDLALARIQITGTGLPNATTYGKTGTYSKQSTTEISDTVSFGNYYVSAFIPNASKYNITYTVSYKRGDKLTANNNNYTNYFNTGSASFSTPTYYIESGGSMSVTVNASKSNGTVIASLTKLSGVTESVGSKEFKLYASNGAYVKSTTTNTSGYAYFYSMPYGTYSIRSDTPPAGHLYDPVNITVTLSTSSITGSFVLKRTTGDLSINYTTEDGNSLNGAIFQITRPDSGSSLYSTNASGSIKLLSLPPGTYKVKQINADVDYEMYAAEISATVTANATAVVDVYNPLLYDFSVGLTVPSSVMQGTPIQITASCANKKANAAVGVPVKIECDGVLIYSNSISIPALSSVNITAFASGTAIGTRAIRASINEPLVKNEKYLLDNMITKTTTVLPGTNLSIEFIDPGTEYLEGTDVISAFRIANTGLINIVPTSQLSVFLGVSYMKNGLRQSIPVMTKDQVIIPAAGDNLVCFKWRVPDDTGGCVFTLNAIVDPFSKVSEQNEIDNSITVTRTVADSPILETPDTRYEEKTPGTFSYTQPVAKPARPSVSWSVWEWVNGWYKKNVYGIQIDAQSAPVITPDSSVPSEEMVDGRWLMGSGYGFNLVWDISLTGVPGTILPGADAVTGIQLARCCLPEFFYAQGAGQARSLERTLASRFEFYRNPYSKTGSRTHFTPLWFPDREYICQGYVSEIWTPAGVVNGYASSNSIQIRGSMYDDWHIER